MSRHTRFNTALRPFGYLVAGVLSMALGIAQVVQAENRDFDERIENAFEEEEIDLATSEVVKIRNSVRTASREHCRKSPTGGNSKVQFAAVDIASQLGLNPKKDRSLVDRITRAIETLPCDDCRRWDAPERCLEPRHNDPDWQEYFNSVIGLNSDSDFLSLVREKSFSPVKISWEDIGRYKDSVWGDRISDVGIWVRRDERDPSSAELALSVRRDNNYRDKVLVVPSENIKVHVNERGRTREYTLPERLKSLGLTSRERDRNVIVSNQFAIVPVPSPTMEAGGPNDEPARSAFNFSIYPYGSTNYVITDVIEGSSEAIVGPGNHQLLFADIDGEKAPFTASRASERPDLERLERELKAKGMDVDVQRYYLIQVPLKKETRGIKLSNMGTPPMRRFGVAALAEDSEGASTYAKSTSDDLIGSASSPLSEPYRRREGLTKVAIGHGETEGEYFGGDGFRGQRAEEPVRVTVVYFVTPVGKVTRADMQTFSRAFAAWDDEALWGGSFVTKD